MVILRNIIAIKRCYAYKSAADNNPFYTFRQAGSNPLNFYLLKIKKPPIWEVYFLRSGPRVLGAGWDSNPSRVLGMTSSYSNQLLRYSLIYHKTFYSFVLSKIVHGLTHLVWMCALLCKLISMEFSCWYTAIYHRCVLVNDVQYHSYNLHSNCRPYRTATNKQ